MKRIIGCLLVFFMIVGSIFFVVGNLHANHSDLDCMDMFAECMSQAQADIVNGDDALYCQWMLSYCMGLT